MPGKPAKATAAGKKPRKLSKYTLPADRDAAETADDDGSAQQPARGKTADGKKAPGDRSAQRNFRVRREAYVKEVEKYHGIYVAENERMREEINRVAILVGATPPDDLQPDYDSMDFKLTLPPPLPRLATTGSRQGSLISSEEQPTPPSFVPRPPAPGRVASGSGSSAWPAPAQPYGGSYTPGAMLQQAARMPEASSSRFAPPPPRVAHWQPPPAHLAPPQHLPPPGSYLGQPWATADFAAGPADGLSQSPRLPAPSYDRDMPPPPQWPDFGAFQTARTVISSTPGYSGASHGSTDQTGTSAAFAAAIRPQPGGWAPVPWQAAAARDQPPTPVPPADAPTRARLTHSGRRLDRLWGAADMTDADMDPAVDDWNDTFDGPLVA